MSQSIIDQDLERIIKKQKITHRVLSDQIDLVINELNEAKYSGEYSSLKEKLKNSKPLSKMQMEHNDGYAYISKMGKHLDKLYQKNNLQYGQEHVELDKETMLELIKVHLLRDGEFDGYEQLVEETQTSNSAYHGYFLEIQQIVNDIKKYQLDSAIDWAIKHNLQQFLFQLQKQKFISLAQNQGKEEAISFARQNKNFQKFSSTNLYEIQQLMTSLLFLNDIKNSKYEYLYQESNWNNLLRLFLDEASKTQNLLNKSEIRTIFNAGCLALPKLIKYNSITKTRSSEIISNDIPIEIEIGKEYKYHSFFVCPVTREVTLPSNPPLLLKCGHVVSTQSVTKMTQSRSKFKCPTCPQENRIAELKQLQFI